MKRGDKAGSITKMADGRFWVRLPRQDDGSRPSLGFELTEQDAEALLQAGVSSKATAKRIGAPTFVKFAEDILDEREKSGIRGIDEERSNFSTHLKSACFATMLLDGSIQPTHIAQWLRAMSLKKALQGRRGGTVATARLIARSTISRVLSLASSIFEEAGPNGRNLIPSNPCVRMKVKRRPGKEATKDKEVFLTLEEQMAIDQCEAIPREDRDFILFAFGSGVRRGEQFNVELIDVDMKNEEVVVRFGSDGLPRKNNQILTVPLFGFALVATERQLARLKAGRPNSLGLLWPSATGLRRKGKPLGNGHFREQENGTHFYPPGAKNPRRAKRGQGTHVYVDRFSEYLAMAGITRHVRWHDMRHTCASALLQGQWGEAWTLAEVKEQLDHSTVQVTERYAKLGKTAHKEAAKKVRRIVVANPFVGYALVTESSTNGGASSSVAAIANELGRLEEVEQRGIEPLTSALRTRNLLDMLRALSEEKDVANPLVTNLATTLAAMLAK